MLVTKTIGIDMGHRIPNHKSKCRNIHGHRYTIEVGVDDKLITDSGVTDEGMVIDFGDLKSIMMEVLDIKYDHGFTIFNKDPFAEIFCHLQEKWDLKIIFVDFIPTAENLAKHWYDEIAPLLAARGIKINHVKVWETPSSTATYTGE